MSRRDIECRENEQCTYGSSIHADGRGTHSESDSQNIKYKERS